ncbi:hypothetical protein IFM89_033930 [Coptis chinensis]|uniref:UBA domain-containing protein n=1 Tax=Coptis chinensis TaxID=261450 RepID=A0A835LWA3_9MAGN|nr:hypothetical protein IFM89_033930 [Coptis chinensis]
MNEAMVGVWCRGASLSKGGGGEVCVVESMWRPKAPIEPDDPQDAVVAQQYLRDYPTFVGTARYWTETFAKRASMGTEEKVQKLVEMGFPEVLVRKTLDSVGGDENAALEKLCTG